MIMSHWTVMSTLLRPLSFAGSEGTGGRVLRATQQGTAGSRRLAASSTRGTRPGICRNLNAAHGVQAWR